MDMLNNVIEMIMGIVDRVFGWIDKGVNAFVEGQNKYIIYAVFLYIIGVFSIGKLKLNVNAGSKK